MSGRITYIFLILVALTFLLYGCGEGDAPLVSSTQYTDGKPPSIPTWLAAPWDVENIWVDRYKVTLRWNKVTVNIDKMPKNDIVGYKIIKSDFNGKLIDTFLVEARGGSSGEFFVDTSADLIEGKEFLYRIMAFDKLLVESEPSAQQLIKMEGSTLRQINSPSKFYWIAGASDVTVYWEPVTAYEDGTAVDSTLSGYELFRNKSNEIPQIPLAILDSAQTSYVDNYLEFGQSYHYWIRAVGKLGHRSPFSEPITVQLSAPPIPQTQNDYDNAVTVPNPPHIGTITSIINENGTRNWSMTWDQPKYNSDGSSYNDHLMYKVFRSDTLNGIYTLLGTSVNKYMSYLDPTTKNYYYKIAAIDTYGNESVLSSAGYQDATIPTIYHDLLNFRVDVTASSDRSIMLKWNDVYGSSNDSQSYVIYRALKPNGNYFRLSSVEDDNTARSYGDASVIDGVEYYYRLTVVNTYGESEMSYFVKGIAKTPEYIVEIENSTVVDSWTYPPINTSGITFQAESGNDYSGGWAVQYIPGNDDTVLANGTVTGVTYETNQDITIIDVDTTTNTYPVREYVGNQFVFNETVSMDVSAEIIENTTSSFIVKGDQRALVAVANLFAIRDVLKKHHLCISLMTLPVGTYDVTFYYKYSSNHGNFLAKLHGQLGDSVIEHNGKPEVFAIGSFAIPGYDDSGIVTPILQEVTYTNIVLDENEFYYLDIFYTDGGSVDSGVEGGNRKLVLDKVVFTGN
ncbi:hypothetical protein KAJ27_11990 [bacterium]|nr:hypothetical protein [bacterium]